MTNEGPGVSRQKRNPPAPGGNRSPQQPGVTPDFSSIPGEVRVPAPPAANIRRPLTQYGTAQEIMGVFRPGSDGLWAKERFEQAPVSDEEQRKANPVALTPIRPVPGFALGTSSGADLAAQLEAGKQGE
jgi:hypothetical protein